MKRRHEGYAWLIPLLLVCLRVLAPATLVPFGDGRQAHVLPSDERPIESQSGAAPISIDVAIIEVPLNYGRTLGVNSSGTRGPKSDTRFADDPLHRVDMPSEAKFIPPLETKTATGNLRGFCLMRALRGDLDVVLRTMTSDRRFRILQRLRLPASDVEPASLWVGWPPRLYRGEVLFRGGAIGSPLVPAQTCTLDVTASIQASGLIHMNIRQDLEWISGIVSNRGIGAVPTTSSSQSWGKLALREGEIIALRGFVETFRQPRFSTGPILKDIPQLEIPILQLTGHTARRELMILLRPIPPHREVSSPVWRRSDWPLRGFPWSRCRTTGRGPSR